MADLGAALERVAELEGELRLYAGEIRRLQYIVAEADRFAAEGPPYDDLLHATWPRAELRRRLAAARAYARGQGPDGPGAAYPVRLGGWRPGMAHRPSPAPGPPELREVGRAEGSDA